MDKPADREIRALLAVRGKLEALGQQDDAGSDYLLALLHADNMLSARLKVLGWEPTRGVSMTYTSCEFDAVLENPNG